MAGNPAHTRRTDKPAQRSASVRALRDVMAPGEQELLLVHPVLQQETPCLVGESPGRRSRLRGQGHDGDRQHRGRHRVPGRGRGQHRVRVRSIHLLGGPVGIGPRRPQLLQAQQHPADIAAAKSAGYGGGPEYVHCACVRAWRALRRSPGRRPL